MKYFKDKADGYYVSETSLKGLIEITQAEYDANGKYMPSLAEIAAEKAEAEKISRQQKALEALPDILAYIAAKADAPVAVKDKAAELVAVKVKVKVK